MCQIQLVVVPILFLTNKIMRSPWKFCNSTELPRSEVFFCAGLHYFLFDNSLLHKIASLRNTLRRYAILDFTLVRCIWISFTESEVMNKIIFTTESVYVWWVLPDLEKQSSSFQCYNQIHFIQNSKKITTFIVSISLYSKKWKRK